MTPFTHGVDPATFAFRLKAGGRIEPDGRMHATYWVTEGERHTPRAFTAVEEEQLRRLAAALRERCKPWRGKQGARVSRAWPLTTLGLKHAV